MNGFSLDGAGRVALITGAGGGLGRATADVFAEAGYRVLLAERDEERGRQAERELRERGAEAAFVATDVRNSEEVERAVTAAIERWQRLDFVLNNAGVSGRGAPVEDLDETDLDEVLAVDLKGVFHVAKHALRAMRQGGGGGLVNVASITAETGSADYAPYAAAKAGVIALTRGLARRVGRFNIRVNCLSPGSIEGTGLMAEENLRHDPAQLQRRRLARMGRIPLGRAAAPRDVAAVALFLAAPLARHVHGAVVTVDGGESLGTQ